LTKLLVPVVLSVEFESTCINLCTKQGAGKGTIWGTGI
jgi:hypothetical protein